MKSLNNVEDLEEIKCLAGQLLGYKVADVIEETGDQGNSGAAVHYFKATIDDKTEKFVAKYATLLERQVFEHLRRQDQAKPHFESNLQSSQRAWLVMEYLEEIPYSGNETIAWAEKLGPALAKIHAQNRGKQPEWLSTVNPDDALKAIYADEWIQLYDNLLSSNAGFSKEFGSKEAKLKSSWQEFKKAVSAEFKNPSQLTLISCDLVPSHWRQRNGKPIFIDWEQVYYGPLYFDLPNMLNDKTVKYYYLGLLKYGWKIPKDEFAEKFSLLSRYLGFRYMSVGLEHWLGRQADSLHSDYWETVGEKFFYKCLDVAQYGYPRPIL